MFISPFKIFIAESDALEPQVLHTSRDIGKRRKDSRLSRRNEPGAPFARSIAGETAEYLRGRCA